MELKDALKKNHFNKDEYRSAYYKLFSDEPTNILETRAVMEVVNNNPQAMIFPTDIEGKFVQIVNDSNTLVSNLKNIYNVFVQNHLFSFPVSSIVDASSVKLETYNIQLKQVIVTSEIPDVLTLNNADKLEPLVINQLANRFSDKLEDMIINSDGSNQSFYGLKVAGSGDAGVYVDGVDQVSTAILTEANLITALGYVSKYRNAKILMNQTTFMTHVFPLMSSSKIVFQIGDKFLIGGHEVILSGKVAGGEIYLADLTYIVGNMNFQLGADKELRTGMTVFGLFTRLGFLPVGGIGAFAKIIIGN